MSEATAAVDPTDHVAAAETTTAAITQTGRRLWLAGLGALAVAAEQARAGFETLTHKGEEIEPAVAARLRRAGETANDIAQRAGRSMKSVGEVVTSATTTVTGATRSFRTADVSQDVERIVEEKLSAALQRLDLPTRADFQALADRIEQLSQKTRGAREFHVE
jgi:poly(hydroxyalkanoate) granule-associated protein